MVVDPPGNRRRRWRALVCWLMFAAGLLLQLVGPHLKIANRAFVIPQKLTTEGNNIRLVEIIGRQRQVQVISASSRWLEALSQKFSNSLISFSAVSCLSN